MEGLPAAAAAASRSEQPNGAQGQQQAADNVDVEIETQKALALQEGKLNEAVDNLLNLEKQSRLAADVGTTKKLAVAIVQCCFAAGAWKKLNEQVVLLSKRRAQLKQAIQAVVQEAMTYIDASPDLETKVEVIKTLVSVTAGKIYLEIERARLSRKLAGIKETQGLIAEAADIMQEVAVETFGAMAKTEKIAFILEQVRLCLDQKDFVRAHILAKKINTRVFVDEPVKKEKKKGRGGQDSGDGVMEVAGADIPPMMELKLMYYQLMIRYYAHMGDYLDICRSYQAIYETPSIQADPSQWIPVLKKIVWFLVLSPHGSMQSSLMHSVMADKKLAELPKFHALLKRFVTMEVVRWPVLAEEYKVEMEEESSIFGAQLLGDDGADGGDGGKALADLRQRVVEHNILVISKYYARITLRRLSELLALPKEETERHLTEMVVSKALIAKVDRPAGIVNFQIRKDSNELLNGWSMNIERLVDLVEKSCHQIHRETMVHHVNLNTVL
ncbi:hypothetical protein CBR_g4871 [Chara braunii]|uniref:PCI domain-containing protein n=1 Tax=Chara braunii TaxID=69332 RepID=A0A388KJ97_CHABU|nr:hypothetical protein CBR_g4871 [Chara braunii]|eukprot:GBG70043.1 hypothetical protein CBR_g4871 [Chara braunii]